MGEKELLLKELEPLIKTIDAFKCGNFLQPTSALFDAVLNNCIVLLSKHSFSVRRLPQHIGKINNINDLVNHYYNMLRLKKSDKVIPSREIGPDLATAKALLKNIQDSLGYEYKDALHFAARMVERLFDLEKQLDLDVRALVSFRNVFGQDKMGWITEQIIISINMETQNQGYLQDLADRETELYVKRKKVQFGWEDLDNLVERLGK